MWHGSDSVAHTHHPQDDRPGIFNTHTAAWTLSDFWAPEVSCLGYILIETRTSVHRFPRLSDQPAGGGSLATTVMVDMSSPPRPSSGEFYGGLGIPGPRGRKGCVLAGKLFPSSRPAGAVTLPQICRAGLGWARLCVLVLLPSDGRGQCSAQLTVRPRSLPFICNTPLSPLPGLSKVGNFLALVLAAGGPAQRDRTPCRPTPQLFLPPIDLPRNPPIHRCTPAALHWLVGIASCAAQ